jgi:hypothetical protein
MEVGEFLRLFPLRGHGLMWFLGAGASAASGIPTASHLIWEFKRAIFCTSQRKPLAAFADLSDEQVRRRIQSYFSSRPGSPDLDSPQEYSYYFEAAYPDEADRRRYLDQVMRNARPSFGHRALAELSRMGLARLLWTTNFDRVLEDALIEAYGTSTKLVTVTGENATTANDALAEDRWPLLIKLHGDFQSRQLKNTSDELKKQHDRLMQCFHSACPTRGMIVVGYSGRDKTVMDAMNHAINGGRGFPGGVFWFRRADSPLLPEVTAFLDSARHAGIQAVEIEVETFDELLSDLLCTVPSPSPAAEQLTKSNSRRLSPAPYPPLRGGWPIVRTNAVPMIEIPAVCRKVVCDIGGYAEVREAISQSKSTIIAARRNVGVLAFGDDDEIRRVFSRYSISEYGLHSIEPHRLRWESAELGLLYDALTAALARERHLRIIRRRADIYAVPMVTDDGSLGISKLRGLVRATEGTLHGRRWYEAARIRILNAMDRLWLAIDPTVVFDRSEGESLENEAKEFIRERLARRYNQTASGLLDCWLDILIGESSEACVSAFGSGIDATFKFSRTTGYSWRGGAR